MLSAGSTAKATKTSTKTPPTSTGLPVEDGMGLSTTDILPGGASGLAREAMATATETASLNEMAKK